MSTSSDSDSSFELYHYKPSLAAAVVFALLFVAGFIWHFILLVKKRTWCFIPFLVGLLFEIIGYGARVYSSKQTPDWTLMPYVMQSLFILLGPTLFAASMYMVLGRLIRNLNAEQHSLVRVNWLTKVFLLGDILSFFGQSGGGGMLASSKTESGQNLGNAIILVGLGIQVVFFAGFILVLAVFHKRISRHPTTKVLGTSMPWERFIKVLYFTSMLIMVRSVFRMVEYAQGQDGSLLKTEIYMYILDALPMTLVAIAFGLYHPSEVLVQHKFFEDGVNMDGSTDSYPMARGHYDRMG